MERMPLGRRPARLPGRVSSPRAARDRAQAAQWRDPGRCCHQRPGAWCRHRFARRRGNGGLPGKHRVHLAAGGPGRPAAERLARRLCGLQRARGPVHRGASGVFFGQSPEHAHINPDNLEIMVSHLKCAAFELPIRDQERFGSHDTGDLCVPRGGRLPAPLSRRLALDFGHLPCRRCQPARRHQR